MINDIGVSENQIEYRNGMMGVPITFLDKYNPDQFEILGIQDRDDIFRTKKYTKEEYKNASDMNRAGVIFVNGNPVMPYRRIFIRRAVV